MKKVFGFCLIIEVECIAGMSRLEGGRNGLGRLGGANLSTITLAWVCSHYSIYQAFDSKICEKILKPLLVFK